MKSVLKKATTLSMSALLAVSAAGLNVSAEIIKVPQEKVQKYCTFISGPYDPNLGEDATLDLSDCDLSDPDLFSYICFNDYTILPSHPSKLPADFNRDEWNKSHLYPGMGIAALHKKGIDGRGVNVAISDKDVWHMDHTEYAGKVKNIKNFVGGEAAGSLSGITGYPDNYQHFHPSYVTSALIGKNCGIAPEAQVLYYCGNVADSAYETSRIASLRWVIEENKRLPEGEKVKVFSMSYGIANPDLRAEWESLVAEAESDGIMVIDSRFGAGMGNAVIPGLLDVNDPDDLSKCQLYNTNKDESNPMAPGSVMTQEELQEAIEKHGETPEMLIVPSGMHTGAFEEAPGDIDKYAYDLPAVSLSVPTLAGIAALGFQIDPSLTPSQVKQFLLETKTENYVVDPNAFVKKVMENKLGEQIPDKVFEQIDSPIVKILTDEATGVKVYLTEKSFAEGTSLHVEPIDKEHADFGIVSEDTDASVKSCTDGIQYYSIGLKNSKGENISLTSNIAVLIPIPDDFDKDEKDLSVFWINPETDEKFDTDNNIIEFQGQAYYMFTTNHLSRWALVDKNNLAFIPLSIAIIALAVSAYVISKNKKKSRNNNI